MQAGLGLLFRILTVDPRRTGVRNSMTYVVIRQPYAHLEEGLLRSLKGLGQVEVVVDRRSAERRQRPRAVASERRSAQRRRDKVEIVEILVPGYLP